jgi:hypothetical protein
VSWQHELALVLVGFAGGVLCTLGALVGARTRDRRGGRLDLDTPAARDALRRAS